MSVWKEYKLGDVCVRLSSGKSISLKDTSSVGDFPIFGGNGTRGYSHKSNFEGECAIIGRQGAYCGNVRYFKGKAYMTEHAVVLIANAENNTRFLSYFLSLQNLGNLSAQSAQPGISVKTLSEQKYLLPPITEQERIVGILSSLDDKIDLLNRQNQTLESMAEALFRNYFIDNAQPDWEDGVISDLIDFNPTRKLAKNNIAPFLEMSELSTSTYAPNGWYERVFTSGTKFQNGDTLLARITPCLENGKTAYVDFLKEDQVGWGSTEYIVMRPKEIIHPFFAYVIAKYKDFRDFAESCMSGSSGRQRVDVENLKSYECKIPDRESINKFNTYTKLAVEKMNYNNTQICTLTKLRNTLLPKLMNGRD